MARLLTYVESELYYSPIKTTGYERIFRVCGPPFNEGQQAMIVSFLTGVLKSKSPVLARHAERTP